MKLLHRLRRLLRHPPREIMRRLVAYGLRRLGQMRVKLRDHFMATHLPEQALPRGQVQSLLGALDLNLLNAWSAALEADGQAILAHRFSLLGAQDVSPGEHFSPPGLEGYRYRPLPGGVLNRANRRHAAKLGKMISPSYRPIDWHVDLRSGYRWSPSAHSANIAFGDVPGADIKLPWELARMQHAPRLALLAAQRWLSGERAGAEQLWREFQDQVLDFVAANPPRYGVNWVCTMDVAIRIANLLVAYDLMQAAGFRFDQDFQTEFKRTVHAHGMHIINNLEWFAHLRSNHYLANVAGLLFVAAYLPASAQTDAWLVLAANEFGKELSTQFQPDGSNFEASTSYHRLSGEMALFSVALGRRIAPRLQTLGLDLVENGLGASGPGPLPPDRTSPAQLAIDSDEAVSLLERIAAFSRVITRPDGGIVQIGDNDSGRFMKLTPVSVDGAHGTEGHGVLIDSIAQLVGDGAPRCLDAMLVANLARASTPPEKRLPQAGVPLLTCFHDFGLYIYSRPRMWLAVRCGAVGQLGNGGHAHNDQLSMEVCFDGIPFVMDPGTYVYTPLPEMRNRLRATAAHATLQAEPGEQNGWLAGSVGLFSMDRVASACVVDAAPESFIGEHDGFSARHRRSIGIEADAITVSDQCDAGGRMLNLPLAPGVMVVQRANGCLLSAGGVTVALILTTGAVRIEPAIFSPAYGVAVATQRICVRDIDAHCIWRLQLEERAHG